VRDRRSTGAGCLLALLALLVGVVGTVDDASRADAASLPNTSTLPSAGCGGTSTVRAGEQTVELSSGGVTRQYIRHVPPAHDGTTALPLVLSLHGWGEGATLHTRTTQWAALADSVGFIVASPDAIDATWRPTTGGADFAFLDQVLDQLEAQLCIDTNRVYVEGYSLGAITTSVLTCVDAGRIAAVAPLAGIYVPPTSCTPSRPMPVLTFHGTDDNWVPYGPVPATVASWAARNGCNAAPAATNVPGDDVVTITRFDYPCPAGAEVEFYSIEHGGHAWPGSEFSRAIEPFVGYTTFAIDATELMWNFFRTHRLHPDIATYTARFSAAQGAALTKMAAARGESVAELVRAGTQVLRALADAGLATPGAPAPAGGPFRVTVAYPLGEAPGIDADAAAWGVNGDQLHTGGGRLVTLLAYLLAL
jgi:polyhydroxybutyrate depolymerase